MHQVYLDRIKSFEGFTPVAKPDYAQHSNGYGTKALYPGELIDRAEAERRFAHEIEQARAFVERRVPALDEGTKAALTSLTFNAGTRWASSGLGDAAQRGDLDAIKERFVQYTKAGGKDLPGLVSRRLAEVVWIGSSAGVAGAPSEVVQAPVLGDAAVPVLAAAALSAPPGEAVTPRTWPATPASRDIVSALMIASIELSTPRCTEDERDAGTRASRPA